MSCDHSQTNKSGVIYQIHNSGFFGGGIESWGREGIHKCWDILVLNISSGFTCVHFVVLFMCYKYSIMLSTIA